MKSELIVSPVITPDKASRIWKQYEDLKKSLLSPSDYQKIQVLEKGFYISKSFIKKSGWRKIATAFNLNLGIITEKRIEYENLGYRKKIDDGVDKNGKPKFKKITVYEPGFVYEVVARATAPNGRFMEATGSCSLGERDFAHDEHDIRATAETRAKNRAIADLVGGGEVSADELELIEEKQKAECTIDHTLLEVRELTRGEAKGKLYVRCSRCKFFSFKEKKKGNYSLTAGKI